MSKIPSSRGSAAGMMVPLQKFDNTSAQMVIGNGGGYGPSYPILDNFASTLSPVNVSEFDEVVLNISLIDNFGDPGTLGWLDPNWGAPGTWTFATSMSVKVMASTMVDFVEQPPEALNNALALTETKHWSPLFLEEIASPFSGVVDIAEYAILLKDIRVGASGGVWSGIASPPVEPNVEKHFNLRVPTTMAEWICFIVQVDTLGASSGLVPAHETAPIVQFDLYRGVAL